MSTPRQEQQRAARDAAAQAQEDLAYTPPPRDSLFPSEYSYFLDDDGLLLLTVRQWSDADDVMADFMTTVEVVDAWDPTGTSRHMIASMDCTNHGTIHFHDEIRDPDHEGRETYMPLRSGQDILDYHEHALEAFIEYAERLYRHVRR